MKNTQNIGWQWKNVQTKVASESIEEKTHIHSQHTVDVNQAIALLEYAKSTSDCDAVISAFVH